jgi:FkbM family methyltransferase
MITEIFEHSVDLSLLPEKANILDAGCRGFEFTRYFRERGHEVTALDIDYLPEKDYYKRIGLSNINGKAYISNDKDEQARKLIGGKEFLKDSFVLAQNEVYTVTLDQLEKHLGRFNLIKLDIEGKEYDVLKEAKHPIAKQVSVEFHAHCGQTKEQIDELLDKINEWYDIHNRVWEERHGCSANYWDILLIAK